MGAWQEVPLADVALSLQDGPFGSNLKSEHYVDRGVRVIRLQNIGAGFFDDRDQVFISRDHFARLQKHECRPGDVLIGTLGDPQLRACVQPATLDVALNKADCLRLRCDESVAVPEFVAQFLNSEVAQSRVRSLAHGQTRARVSLSQVRALRIPLPSLQEQRSIAETLGRAAALRSTGREWRTLLQAYVDSALYRDSLVNGENRARWPRLGDISVVQGGLQVTRARASYALRVPYLRVANVHRGRLDLAEIKTIRVSISELNRSRLEEGDLLVVEGHGNEEEIGRVAQWAGEIEDCVHQNHLIRVRVDSSVAYPSFVEAFLNSDVGRLALRRAARTTSGLNTISTNDVRSVPVPLPPMAVQAEFDDQVRLVSNLRRSYETRSALLDELFECLRASAFDGVSNAR